MQIQMVKSGAIISGGYLLIGMIVRGFCEINEIKVGSKFHIYRKFMVTWKATLAFPDFLALI